MSAVLVIARGSYRLPPSSGVEIRVFGFVVASRCRWKKVVQQARQAG